jgi:hypothetical protein
VITRRAVVLLEALHARKQNPINFADFRAPTFEIVAAAGYAGVRWRGEHAQKLFKN